MQDQSILTPSRLNLLVFDSQVSGHHLEYITYVINWAQHQTLYNVTICAAEAIIAKLILKRSNYVDLTVVPDTGSTFTSDRANKECAFILQQTEARNISKVVFLNINPYQIELLKWRFRSLSFTVSGILFGSHHRMIPHRSSSIPERVRISFAKVRKAAQLKILSNNPLIEQVFLLDDEAAVAKLNPSYDGKLAYLPDPISTATGSTDFVEPAWWPTLKGNRVFLIFGSLAPRKNVKNSILGFLSAARSNSMLVIVGNGTPSYLKELHELISSNSPGSQSNIVFEPGFASTELLNALFKRADVIMMVYKHFFGSSGILGNAAKWNKPVIAGNAGLVKELVHRYDLGVCTEPTIQGVADGIRQVDDDNYMQEFSPREKYITDKTVSNFTSKLFQSPQQ